MIKKKTASGKGDLHNSIHSLIKYIIAKMEILYKLFSGDIREGYYKAYLGGIFGISVIFWLLIKVLSELTSTLVEMYRITLEFIF